MKSKLVKKIFAAILAAAMLLPSSHTGMETVWAEQTEEGYMYDIGEDSVTFRGLWEDEDAQPITEIVIPAIFEGKPVTEIASFALSGKTSLSSITIPSSVTSIGQYAFRNTGLISVTIPDGVKEIGFGIFSGCSSLESITLPDGLISSSSGAEFENCVSLKSVTLPKSFNAVDSRMFENCRSLTYVTIPSTVYTIYGNAFFGCENLKDIYYAGTEQQWNRINKQPGNDLLDSVTIHYNSSGPSGSGGGTGNGDDKDPGNNSGNGDDKKPNGDSENDGDKKPGGDSESKQMDISKTASVTYEMTCVYDGKAKTPAVTVRVGNKTLTANKDYTVSYQNNINVGQATLTVTGKGSYTGNIIKAFEIVPKGTDISGKVKAQKKALTIKWKKQTKSVDGYEIWCSTDKGFSTKATVKKTAKTKAVKLTVKKLKAKKTYYVKIRTYKSVKGKKYYSSWSKVKSAKTK